MVEPAPPFSGEASFAAVPLELVVEPADADRPDVRVRVRARLGDGRPVIAAGAAAEVDALATEVALALAAGLGKRTPPGIEHLLEDDELPFLFHRHLGRGELRVRSGELVKARLLYERAVDHVRERITVEGLLAVRGLRGSGSRPGLVSAALERHGEARRKGEPLAALEAALDAVRFGLKPRLRWRLDLPRGARRIGRGDTDFFVARASGWVRFDASSGAPSRSGRASAPPLASANGELFVLDGGELLRLLPSGEARWRLRLPAGLTTAALAGAGQVAVFGARGLAWVEASLGTLLPVSEGVVCLGVGEGGAIVGLPGQSGVALYRPGRRAAAWTASVAIGAEPAGVEVVTTTARVIVRGRGHLEVLDLHDGRRVMDPLPVPPAARLLGAGGRHAVVALGGRGALVVDVLAGAPAARVLGPGRPVAAHSGPFAVSVAYETGDVLHFDPDGPLLDRSRVDGQPIAVHDGPPGAPGPVIETEAGLYAFSEVLPSERVDLDLLLAAARAAARAGRHREARALATHVAQIGAGRVGEAETLRAELLERLEDPLAARAAADARRRAEAARDPSRPLPPFCLVAPESERH